MSFEVHYSDAFSVRNFGRCILDWLQLVLRIVFSTPVPLMVHFTISFLPIYNGEPTGKFKEPSWRFQSLIMMKL